MKDNLLRAETPDIPTGDTDWSSSKGLRHSIRPRRALVPVRADITDDTPLADLLAPAGADQSATGGFEHSTQDQVSVSAGANADTKNMRSQEPEGPMPAITAPEIEAPQANVTPVRVNPVHVNPARATATRAEVTVSGDMPPEILQRMSAPSVIAPQDTPQWQDLPMIELTGKRARSSMLPVMDAARDSLSVQAFDLLRTRLRQTTREHGWTNIAVTAPTRGCGNTFTAANLALSLSRIPGTRSVLMDLNLRNPGIADALAIPAPGEMRDYLSGDVPLGDHIQRVSDTLALGLNAAPDLDAAETLQNPALSRTLDRMRAALRPDMVIYDMPSMLGHDDVSAFLPHLDGVLLVSDGTQTMGKQLTECERMLDGQVPLLGVVLNRARANSLTRYR